MVFMPLFESQSEFVLLLFVLGLTHSRILIQERIVIIRIRSGTHGIYAVIRVPERIRIITIRSWIKIRECVLPGSAGREENIQTVIVVLQIARECQEQNAILDDSVRRIKFGSAAI